MKLILVVESARSGLTKPLNVDGTDNVTYHVKTEFGCCVSLLQWFKEGGIFLQFIKIIIGSRSDVTM